MNILEQFALAAMHKIDPERAHGMAIKALQLGLAGGNGPITSARLKTSLCGMDLPNPLGLAAGFDKNAQAMAGLARAGFGFAEVGAITPRAQPGNPKPRLFRLTDDRAAINRFGFNNDGIKAAAPRLAARPKGFTLGLNLGANKDSADRAADYAQVLAQLGQYVDFATVNVSSPNTEKLRDLQGAEALRALLQGVLAARKAAGLSLPVFLKIAPDLTRDEISQIAQVAMDTGIDAIIATNTTLSRDGLKSPYADQAGGLSGAPVFERSTKVLAQFYQTTGGQIPLIGVGGIGSGADAYAKIKAGASALQIYTALVYGGLSLVDNILRELDDLLARDGFDTITEARGIEAEQWAA